MLKKGNMIENLKSPVGEPIALGLNVSASGSNWFGLQRTIVYPTPSRLSVKNPIVLTKKTLSNTQNQ